MALLVLLTWICNAWQFGTLGRRFIPMAPSTACLFLLLGCALFLRSRWPKKPIIHRFACFAVLFTVLAGLLVLAQHGFGFELPLEHWLAPTTATVDNIPVGRMSPLTATAFLLSAVAFLLVLPPFDRHRAYRQFASLMATATLLISLAVLLSYAVGAPLLYSSRFIPMAFVTAVSFAMLNVGTLIVIGPSTFPLSIFKGPSHSPASLTLRQSRFSRLSETGVLAGLMVLALGGLATVCVTMTLYRGAQIEAQMRFDRMSGRVVHGVAQQMESLVSWLRGTRGLYEASKSVERGEFQKYFESTDMRHEFPGALGLGFIQRVPRAGLQEFIASERKDEAPEFEVKTAGESSDLFIVKFIEPLAANLPACGYDIGSERLRREAAERAMRSGESALTPKIELVQDPGKRLGLLLLLPVYRNGTNPRTPQEREAALVGWVYNPIIVGEALAGIFLDVQGQLNAELFDGPNPTEQNQLFVISAPGHPNTKNGAIYDQRYTTRMFHYKRSIHVGGREWLLQLSSTPVFDASIHRSGWRVAATLGTVISVLLSAVAWSMGIARSRAVKLVIERERQALLNSAGDGIYGIDLNGLTTFANPIAVRLLGYSREELIGQPLHSFTHHTKPDGSPYPSSECPIYAALRDGSVHHVDSEVFWRKDGTSIPVDYTSTSVRNENGDIQGAVVVFRDITERLQQEQELRKLSRVVEETSASVIITDVEGRIEFVNQAFVDVTGYTADEVKGKNPRILKSGLTPAQTYEEMWNELSAGRDWRGELHNRGKNGELYWVLGAISPLQDAQGKTTHYVAVQEDITMRKQMEDDLRSAARTDKLTGLANRAMFCDRLQQAVARAKRIKNYRFAVLFLDFDRFKLLNDTLGHDVGDLLLQEIARRIRQTVRSGDSLSHQACENVTARFGGDEFVVLLDGIRGAKDAVGVAGRLLETFAQPYHLGEHEAFSTASIGIVTSDTPADNAEEVLRNADIAMYEAKLAGRGRYLVFDSSMHERIQNRLSLENDLRKALDSGQLLLMYQPIVSLETGEVAGFEALIRWNHPERGLILPDEFIPIAEDTGLIVLIGEWVLRESCRQFAAWRRSLGDAAPRSISVNLSRNQLAQPDLPLMIRRILEETGVPSACLNLELTESTVMRDVETAARILREIKETGVKLSLDDFGTGHSSLSCLHQLPIDFLKIDRSFVANIDRGRDFIALIYAAVQLARNLRISVVAEGVETMDQIATLLSMECEFGQGYIFSRPLMAADVPEFRCQDVLFPAQSASG